MESQSMNPDGIRMEGLGESVLLGGAASSSQGATSASLGATSSQSATSAGRHADSARWQSREGEGGRDSRLFEVLPISAVGAGLIPKRKGEGGDGGGRVGWV